MTSGALSALLKNCRAEDAKAWEEFSTWVRARGRTILTTVRQLSAADRQDAIADVLQSLMVAVRRGGITGDSNAEIDAYVCAAIRNRALTMLRRAVRRQEAGEMNAGASGVAGNELLPEAIDSGPTQDTWAVVTEELNRAERAMVAWSPADRYLLVAKLNGVATKVIQRTLGRPPFGVSTTPSTVDTRFHRLRERLVREMRKP